MEQEKYYPKEFTEIELDKVDVNLLDKSNVKLECQNCGQVWSPCCEDGGSFSRGYWKCPKGCNH